jgi:transcription elongation factor GreA
MNSQNQITQEGYDQLSKELSILKTKQIRLISEIEEVAQPDESGEDGLATQLKEELELVMHKIDELEKALESSKIISGSRKKSNCIDIGSVVKIKISGNSTKEFCIVSDLESNPSENKISNNSPLGLALIGKKVNESIEVEAPIGKITYKIVAIK